MADSNSDNTPADNTKVFTDQLKRRLREGLLDEREKGIEKRKADFDVMKAHLDTREANLEKIKVNLEYLGKKLEIDGEKLRTQQEKLSHDLSVRSETLQEREGLLSRREQSMSAHFAHQQKQFSEQNDLDRKAIEADKFSILKEQDDLETEKRNQGEAYRLLLEKNSSEYVENTLTKLNLRFAAVNDKSAKWQFFGAASLILGLAYFGLSAWYLNPLDPSLGWKNIIYLSLRGALIVSLIAGLTTYASRTSKILRDEATKIADRMHAIDYGAFYLKTYGANADWEQVKEAFKDWNTADNETAQPSEQSHRTENEKTHSKRRLFNASRSIPSKSK